MPRPPHLDRVVVTGAAGGIGTALAERLHAAGCRLVLSDLPGPSLTALAERLGAYAVPADCTDPEGVAGLVRGARERLGGIDAFFANAGIIGPLGLGADDEAWQRTLDINVLAHVRAARLLVPEWTARGGGRFVVTASAAGLLTMFGAAAYAVTKHAAVAFAEWLRVTHAADGVIVQALCPQGVDTAMVHSAGPVAELLRDGAVTPEHVADTVWEALGDGRFLILPHPEVGGYYRHRASAPDDWLARMSALNSQLTEADSPAAPSKES